MMVLMSAFRHQLQPEAARSRDVVTGRASPEAPFPTDLVARSQSFAFGIARGGIVEGWPSGHAMTNVAMATALIVSPVESDTRCT